LNGAETLAIALLEVMLCPKQDAPIKPGTKVPAKSLNPLKRVARFTE
jgi:hypothetical protein